MKPLAAIIWMLGILAGSALAADLPEADGRGAAAIAYVEALRSGRAATACSISNETGPRRREDIQTQWRSMQNLLDGSGGLHVEAVRGDSELAAVLVRADPGEIPTEVAVVPVALVHRQDGWHAAPLPGLFANAGLAYDDGLRARASQLETWLAEEHLQRAEAAEQHAAARFDAAMQQAVKRESLRGVAAAAVMRKFLEVAERRDFPAIMAITGGLHSARPDGWDEQLRVIARSLREVDMPGKASAWGLLTHPEIVRVFFVEKDVPPYFGIGFYDPYHSVRGGLINEMFFELEKIDDVWRINLPQELRAPTPMVEGEENGVALWIGRGAEEEIPEWLPKAFERSNPALGFDDPKALATALVAAIEANRFPEVLRMLVREPGGDRAERGQAYLELARFWQQVRPLGEPTLTQVLDVESAGDAAAISLRGFSAARSEDLVLCEIYAVNGPNGWALVAPGSPPADEKLATAVQPLVAKEGERRKAHTLALREGLLASANPLDQIAAEAPDSAAASTAVERWRNAAAAGKLADLFASSAWLNRPGEPLAVLRTLGSEVTAAIGTPAHYDILAVHHDGPWALVSTRVVRGTETSYPAHVVVKTPAGARVLVSADLDLPLSRIDAFVNQTQWMRLEKLVTAEQLAGLRRAFAGHLATCVAHGAPDPSTTP